MINTIWNWTIKQRPIYAAGQATSRAFSNSSPKLPLDNLTLGDLILRDKYNRFHNYLRISITERCNLRCQYCMPEDGVELTPSSEILTRDEVRHLAEPFVRAGVDKIRVTGGEPLVRKDAVEIVGDLSSIPGVKSVGITTNGITLKRRLPGLKEAGLAAVNISIDSLVSAKHDFVTRRINSHKRVLEAIDSAVAAGIPQVKVNVVVMRGFNEDELGDFVEYVRDRDVELRFIEFMPFDDNRWS